MIFNTMLSSTILLSVLLAVWVLPFGHSLKCYSYVCSNSSMGSSPPCAPPQEFTCPSIPGSPIVPDRCMTQRFLFESSIPGVGGVITVHQEIRNCSYSLQCEMLRDMLCNAANVTGNLKKCEAGCCQGDLCNSGGPIATQAPRPTGPSGADLSCLACSNIPGTGVQRNCGNPITQSCGAGPLSSFFSQDRCMTVKAAAKLPGIPQSMEFEMKNCSNAAMCNPVAFCTAANNSVNGAIQSCQVSCCFGNLCNVNGAMMSTSPATTTAARATGGATGAAGVTGAGGTTVRSSATTTALLTTGLTCFSAFTSYFYFIVVV